MKFIVTFKTPDTLDRAAKDFGREYAQLSSSSNNKHNDEEMELLTESLERRAKDFASKFIKYGEYIRLEFDMIAGTAKVLPAN